MTRQDDPPSTEVPVPAHAGDRPSGAGWRGGAWWAALLGADLGTPLAAVLLPALVRGVNGLLVLGGVGAVLAAFWLAPWWGLLALVGVPLVVLGGIALTRLAAELALAVLGLTGDVTGIATRLSRLESSVSEVANDMPRFGFLKVLAAARDR